MQICENDPGMAPAAAHGCPPAKNAGSTRAGLTLLEITVASAILAVLLTASIQMLQAVSSQQRAADRQAVATLAVQAIAEQIGNIPWDQLTSEAAAQVAIPAPLERYLPAGKLVATVEEQTEPVVAKRVYLELTWSGPGGKQSGPVRLTSWVFPEP
jgi:prepilin-type N-terminal cleavage/methylation domain-containing protein